MALHVAHGPIHRQQGGIDMGIFIVVLLIGVFVLAVGADLWLKYHPLKKADAKAKKYEYRGF